MALLDRIAFPEIRVSKPVPIRASHQKLQRWLVLLDIFFECLRRILIKIHVRVGVIAKREASLAPELQDLYFFGMLFEFLGVHEAIDLGHVRLLQSGETLTAREAMHIGLAHQVLPQRRFLLDAEELLVVLSTP